MRKLGLAGLLILVVFNHTFARSISSDHSKINDYSSEYKFNPFFRTEEYQDLPPVPKLNKFDKAILGVCGSWGDTPRNSNFMSILNDSDYKDEVNSIYDELDHQVISSNADIETFKKELAMVWSQCF